MSSQLTQKANEINNNFFPNVEIMCNDIELLIKDSNRKRFIDVITSIISRYITNDIDSTKNLSNINDITAKSSQLKMECNDITEITTEYFEQRLDDMAKGKI